MVWMTKATMLERTRILRRVEGSGAIVPNDHIPGLEILHRATNRVKSDKTIIVKGELAHRNQVLNKIRRDQNIIKT